MAIENSESGILTIDDAAEKLFSRYEADEADTNEDEAAEVEETELDDITDAEEAEEDELSEVDEDEPDGESEEAETDDATLDDEDTEDDIDADELKKGYLRQSDYTRKAQALAQERQAFEAERSAHQSQAQQELANLKAAIDAYTIPTEAEPDWVDLARTKKPEELQVLRAEWDDKQAKRQEAVEIKSRIDEATHMQTRHREEQLLLQRIPEWSDAEVLQADLQAMGPVAAEYGISQEELAGIIDHRQIAIMRDLAVLKRSQKKVAQKKAKPKRKVVAAAAPNKVDPREKQKRNSAARLKKTGNVNDAVEVLMGRAAG